MMNSLKRFIKKIWGIESLNANVERLRFELIRKNMVDHLVNDISSGVSKERYCNHDIVVSLTTFGDRLYEVAVTIESIMQQSMKANRIILWLADSIKYSDVPNSLKKLEERGLEIKFCRDIRSYKKLIPSLQECPESAIITVDDDVIYEYDVLEKLIQTHLSNPQLILCNRNHEIRFDANGTILPYNKWKLGSSSLEISPLNFPTGVGGVLYPPYCFADEVLDENVFMDICMYADDIWFKAMALKKGVFSRKVYTHDFGGKDFVANPELQKTGLRVVNTMGNCLNDKQFKAVFDKYDLWHLLKA